MLTLAEYLTALAAGGWTPPDLTGTEIVVQPHCHHASVLGFEADLALLRAAPVRPSPGSAAAAAWPGTSASSWGTTRPASRSPSRTCCPRCARPAPDAVILADGMSCRIQLADLAGVRAVHLAELLAGR